MRQIHEITVDGTEYDAEADSKGVTFRKRGSNLPFLSIVWQDVYSAAWKFCQIRTEYENKTNRGAAHAKGEDG
jgi:hypothetical protein